MANTQLIASKLGAMCRGRYVVWMLSVDCISFAKVTRLKLIQWEIGSQCNNSSRGWAWQVF